MGVIQLIGILLRALLANRAALAMENLALRQQLAVLERSVKRPALRQRDRIFWAWLARLWNGWRAALLIVKPETVIKWHRQGFRLYWRWKSRCRKPGRPKIKREVRDLIRRMSRENPIWGVHVIVLNEDHLHRILTEYFAYYHHARTHLALGRNAPMPRAVEPPEKGEVVSTPYLGGLHHLYTRAA